MDSAGSTHFAPQLYIREGVKDISFYIQAFGAIELRRFSNDDGSIHVSELSVNGCMFHLHEENPAKGQFSPENQKGTTTAIGIFVPDVDLVMKNAIAAGAKLKEPAQSHDYGYRQGEFIDPFGHLWLIEMKI